MHVWSARDSSFADRAAATGHESCLIEVMRSKWFRNHFGPKADASSGQRDESRAKDRSESTNSLRNSLVEKAMQRDLTGVVGVLVTAFAIGMFLTVFYSFAYLLMVRFNAVVERAAG